MNAGSGIGSWVPHSLCEYIIISACVPLGPLPPIGGEVPATGDRRENVVSRDTRCGGGILLE